jgi:hypothetical protein
MNCPLLAMGELSTIERHRIIRAVRQSSWLDFKPRRKSKQSRVWG